MLSRHLSTANALATLRKNCIPCSWRHFIPSANRFVRGACFYLETRSDPYLRILFTETVALWLDQGKTLQLPHHLIDGQFVYCMSETISSKTCFEGRAAARRYRESVRANDHLATTNPDEAFVTEPVIPLDQVLTAIVVKRSLRAAKDEIQSWAALCNIPVILH